MADKKMLIADTVDNLRRVFQSVNEYSKKTEHETGLTGPQLGAIKVISDTGPICVSDLAGRMHLHAATVIGILDRLEGRGLIDRLRSRDDRRFVMVELSKRGRSLVEKSPEIARDPLAKGFEQMPRHKLENISEGLQSLAELLSTSAVPPGLLRSPGVTAKDGKTGGRPGKHKPRKP